MERKLRCKFRCNNVEKTTWGDETVYLNAVYSDDKTSENYSFATATPCANLTMTISNPAAQGFFKPGQEFYLDLTPVQPPAPAA